MSNKKNIIGIIVIACIVVFAAITLVNKKTEDGTMLDFTGKNYKEAEFFANQYNLNLDITYKENKNYNDGTIISQSINKGTVVKENQKLEIVVAKNE